MWGLGVNGFQVAFGETPVEATRNGRLPENSLRIIRQFPPAQHQAAAQKWYHPRFITLEELP